MIGAGLPQHVATPHPLIADQHVLQRKVQRMPDVEAPGHVRGRHHDRVRRLCCRVARQNRRKLPTARNGAPPRRRVDKSCPAFQNPSAEFSQPQPTVSATLPRQPLARSPRGPAARRYREDDRQARFAASAAAFRARSPPACDRRRRAAVPLVGGSRAAARPAERRRRPQPPMSRSRRCARGQPPASARPQARACSGSGSTGAVVSIAGELVSPAGSASPWLLGVT